MIRELQKLRKKYKEISKNSEYISIIQVMTDLYQLENETRVKRLPKNER